MTPPQTAEPRPRGGEVFQKSWCAEGYDADRFGGPFGRYLEDAEVVLFTGLLDRTSTRILDAGAGTGKLALALMERRAEVTASDFSLPMLGVARAKAAAQGLPARFVAADLQSLAFADRSFDCAVCSRVLMHVGRWHVGVRELCRVARAAVILDFPARASFAGLDALWKQLRAGSQHGPRQAYRTFTVREVSRELERHGFTVVRVVRSFVLPVQLHRWLNRPRLSRAVEAVGRMLGFTALLGSPVTVKAVRKRES